MAWKSSDGARGRREFLKQSLTAAAAAAVPGAAGAQGSEVTGPGAEPAVRPSARTERVRVAYPRVFAGPQLSQISFPLGGVGAGSIGLGGRGQLRDWQIFNRPDRGNTPDYAFASIWAKAENGKPIARVLESRIAPPYEGQ